MVAGPHVASRELAENFTVRWREMRQLLETKFERKRSDCVQALTLLKGGRRGSYRCQSVCLPNLTDSPSAAHRGHRLVLLSFCRYFCLSTLAFKAKIIRINRVKFCNYYYHPSVLGFNVLAVNG